VKKKDGKPLSKPQYPDTLEAWIKEYVRDHEPKPLAEHTSDFGPDGWRYWVDNDWMSQGEHDRLYISRYDRETKAFLGWFPRQPAIQAAQELQPA
jgi:hypothetical protein